VRFDWLPARKWRGFTSPSGEAINDFRRIITLAMVKQDDIDGSRPDVWRYDQAVEAATKMPTRATTASAYPALPGRVPWLESRFMVGGGKPSP
jgi:hypothetical protein